MFDNADRNESIKMKVTVKVPATTANIGPGFDIFGMALPLYNEITIEETVIPHSGVEFHVLDENGEENLYVNNEGEENIVLKAIEFLYNFIGQDPDSLKITIKTGIPIARGLGSSASVIVGGLIAANELLGKPSDLDALLAIATEVEGHPDNIVPAFVGGLAISSQEEDGHVVYRKLEWNKDWKLTVCIPDYELQTGISRSILPKETSYKNAVFNAKRCAMFVEAIHTKDENLMKLALQDKLHQPYRMKLVPGLEEIIRQLKNEDDVLGCVLSGAGPSILIISKNSALDKIKEVVNDVWTNLNIRADIINVEMEQKGAFLIED